MRLYSWLLLGLVMPMVFGCGTGEPDNVVSQPVAVSDAASKDVPLLMLWTHSCALCHVDGNGGAPRMGDVEEWAPRLAKGEALLLQHTLEGFNQMPPLGYCMVCERSDFVAMINWMSGRLDAVPERAQGAVVQ